MLLEPVLSKSSSKFKPLKGSSNTKTSNKSSIKKQPEKMNVTLHSQQKASQKKNPLMETKKLPCLDFSKILNDQLLKHQDTPTFQCEKSVSNQSKSIFKDTALFD